MKGLMIRVQPSGSMSFYLEYQRGKRVNLGKVGAITLVQAKELANQVFMKARSGEDPVLTKKATHTRTFLDYLDTDYKDWLEQNLRTGQATHKQMRQCFKGLHHLRLDEVSPADIEKWRSQRIKAGLKPTSINRDLSNLKAMFNRLEDWEVLKTNPISKVKRSKVDDNAVQRYLKPDEEVRLFKALDDREARLREERRTGNEWRSVRGYELYESLDESVFADHLKPAVLLSLHTGLRRKELFTLQWADVDLDEERITLRPSNAKVGRSRHIELNQSALDCLKAWKAQADKTFVFVGKGGNPLHDVNTSWENLMEAAQIEDFRWHDLRHTFASKLVMKGVDLNTVREFMGHSNMTMTLRYAHLAPEHKKAAIRRLDK